MWRSKPHQAKASITKIDIFYGTKYKGQGNVMHCGGNGYPTEQVAIAGDARISSGLWKRNQIVVQFTAALQCVQPNKLPR